MYCNNCGTKNENSSNFCVNCGNKLEKTVNVVNNDNSNVVKENLKSTNLSIASLVCLIIKFVSIFTGFLSSNSWFYGLPWLLASLILAIISRIKYKDKMSKILIIIDIILIVIGIIIFILLIIFLSSLISGFLQKLY